MNNKLLTILVILGIGWAGAPACASEPISEVQVVHQGHGTHHGPLTVRSTEQGYVVSMVSDEGSFNLIYRSQVAVPTIQASESHGKLFLGETEAQIYLPSQGQLIRLTLSSYPGSLQNQLSPAAWTEERRVEVQRLHNEAQIIEVTEGVELVYYSPMRPGLGMDELDSYRDDQLESQVWRSRGLPRDTGLQALPASVLHQTPDPPGGGGCSYSCSIACSDRSSCSVSCGSCDASCSCSPASCHC